MQGIIDIHSHVLPDVDDGAKDMDMSMEMIKCAYAQGVRGMIATPHYYPGHKNCPVNRLQEVYQELCEKATSLYEDFHLYLGQEIYYKDNVTDLLKQKEILTMAGTRYILLEFSTRCRYEDIYGAVRKTTQAGYYPILAHVERYQTLYEKRTYIPELIEAGAYIQVNAENYTLSVFSRERRFCMQQLKEGNIHFFGSDCHNMKSRKPDMDKVLKYAAEQQLAINPQKIIEGIFLS